MPTIKTLEHDPDSVVDYAINWSAQLDAWGDDTIDTSTWIVPDELVAEEESHTTTVATVWLSGGTVGELHRITNRITTAGGRTDDQSFMLRVAEQ